MNNILMKTFGLLIESKAGEPIHMVVVDTQTICDDEAVTVYIDRDSARVLYHTLKSEFE